VNGQRLPERIVKDPLARGIDEVGEQQVEINAG
jgi:hypothetical protein